MPRKTFGKTVLVPRLKEGPPKAYLELLATAKRDYREKSDRVKEAERAVVILAKEYCRKLYDILIDDGYQPRAARDVVVDDCIEMWEEGTILKHLPKISKHSGRSHAGEKSGEARKQKSIQRKQELKDEVFDSLKPDTAKTTKAKLESLIDSKSVKQMVGQFIKVMIAEKEYNAISEAYFKSKNKKCELYIRRDDEEFDNVQPA